MLLSSSSPFQGYPTTQMPYMQQQYYPSYAYSPQQASAQGTTPHDHDLYKM